MKAKAKFMSTLLVIDTFFVAFCVGFNSHPVLVVDESLPVYKPPVGLATTEVKTTRTTSAADPVSPRGAKSPGAKAASNPSAGAKNSAGHVSPDSKGHLSKKPATSHPKAFPAAKKTDS